MSSINTEPQTETVDESFLVTLNENWSIWREFCFRSAGFDSKLTLQLATPESGKIARQILKQEQVCDDLCNKLSGLVESKLKEAEDKKIFFKAKNKLNKGKIFESELLPSHIQEKMQTLKEEQEKLDLLRNSFLKKYETEELETSERLWQIGQSSKLQEAIIWQNYPAFERSLKPWLTSPYNSQKKNWKDRSREIFLSSYIQRYATKNDTIGFFGPIAWGQISNSDYRLNFEHGEEFIILREIFSEGWAIDAFAEAISNDEEMLPWLYPRRLPYVRVEGNNLFVKDEKPQNLPKKFCKVLEFCEEKLCAKEISEILLKENSSEFRSEIEIFNILKMLNSRNVISWSLEVPWILDFPKHKTLEENFIIQINKIKDEKLRQKAANKFAEYRKAIKLLRTVNDSPTKLIDSFSPEELLDSFFNVENMFFDLTGQKTNRHEGKMYAGRTLIFQECLRDISVSIGQKLLEEISEPISLLLKSANWITNRASEIYSDAFETIYESLVKSENGKTEIDFFLFWKQVNALFFHPTENLANLVLPEFQAKWERILHLSEKQRVLKFNAKDLEKGVMEEFGDNRPGWETAKYHSPDFLIAAESIEQIKQGNHKYILGEFHIGLNTITNMGFMRIHPSPDKILKNFNASFHNRRVILVPPKEMITFRNFPVFNFEKDYCLAFTKDYINFGTDSILHISELIVDRKDGKLHLFTRDKTLSFSLIVVFSDLLSGICANLFKMIAPARHTPRVEIDNLVVNREAWRIPITELDFVREKDAKLRYLEAQRFRLNHGIPRFVFIKFPNEVKPFYLDFESPIFLENIVKIVNKMLKAKEDNEIIISEMLPAHDQLWMNNNAGEIFTNEFRFIFVDNAGLYSKSKQ